MTPPDAQDYSPESIDWWLRHWPMLVSATEGGTCSNGQGAGRARHQNLSDLKADLELATDQLPLHWAVTARIFKRQQRFKVYLARCAERGRLTNDVDQPLDVAVVRMAIFLGWTPLAGSLSIA